ncbi:MAG TPA: hypothetical protein VFB07_07430 [Vicinamibacterales bacterium]|nr:hypothetical protein [Vicinamibacterales bacterium]
MRFMIFLLLAAQAAPELDFAAYRSKVEPLLLEKRPGHARCVVCHSTGTAFRLQPLAKGQTTYTEEQSQKNFEMVKKFVRAGHPDESRLLLMPLAHEAGGTEFHPGGKHWASRADPEWRTLADWVDGGR